MQSFKFLFCLILFEMILQHTDKFRQTLQQPKFSSVEGHTVEIHTVKTLEGLQTYHNFELFWKKVEKTTDQFGH